MASAVDGRTFIIRLIVFLEGFPVPGFTPDFEAMKTAHSAAISSNEKIFPIFAKKLASGDAQDFANTARKLAVWLGSEKAYYAAARPKVRSYLTATQIIPIA